MGAKATPESGLADIAGTYGTHEGKRALHAKGVLCRASFTAGSDAARLTSAAHMQGEPVEAIVRLSNGSGHPRAPDNAPDVRGLAVSFVLPSGERTDLLGQTAPNFSMRSPEEFFAVVRANPASATGLVKLPLLMLRHPHLARGMRANLSALRPPASFATCTFFPIHAYRWTGGADGPAWVRYRWVPEAEGAPPGRAELKRLGRDYLFEDLRERLAAGPVRWRMELQIAGEGDDPHDPSSRWPEDRERMDAGVLEVTELDENGDDSIVFDPCRVVDGIELSDDPVLRFRPAIYDASHRRRTG